MDGYSLAVQQVSRTNNSLQDYYVFRSQGAVNAGGEKWTQVTPCDGTANYRIGDCTGADKYDCDRNLYVRATLIVDCWKHPSKIDYNLVIQWLIYAKPSLSTVCVNVASGEFQSIVTGGSCSLPISKTMDFTNTPYLPDVCQYSAGAGLVFGNSLNAAWSGTITE